MFTFLKLLVSILHAAQGGNIWDLRSSLSTGFSFSHWTSIMQIDAIINKLRKTMTLVGTCIIPRRLSTQVWFTKNIGSTRGECICYSRKK